MDLSLNDKARDVRLTECYDDGTYIGLVFIPVNGGDPVILRMPQDDRFFFLYPVVEERAFPVHDDETTP